MAKKAAKETILRSISHNLDGMSDSSCMNNQHRGPYAELAARTGESLSQVLDA